MFTREKNRAGFSRQKQKKKKNQLKITEVKSGNSLQSAQFDLSG